MSVLALRNCNKHFPTIFQYFVAQTINWLIEQVIFKLTDNDNNQ